MNMKPNNLLSVFLIIVILFSFAYIGRVSAAIDRNVLRAQVQVGNIVDRITGLGGRGQGGVRTGIGAGTGGIGTGGVSGGLGGVAAVNAALQPIFTNGRVESPYFVATNNQAVFDNATHQITTLSYPDVPASRFPYASTTVITADDSVITNNLISNSSSLGYASTTAITIGSGNIYLGSSQIPLISNGVVSSKYGGLGISIDKDLKGSDGFAATRNELFYVNSDGVLTSVTMATPVSGKILQYNGDSFSWVNDQVGGGGILKYSDVDGLSILGAIPYTNFTSGADAARLTTSSSFNFDGTNLGVGTSTPGSILSLGGIANFTTATSTFYSSGGINLAAGCFSVAGSCISGGAGSQWITSVSNIYYTTGNVGIGTTSPSARFSLTGSGTGTGRLVAVSGSNNIEKFTVLDKGWAGVGSTSPSAKLSVTADGTGTGRLFAVADSNNAEKFTVFDNGNILVAGGTTFGIGTTSPSAKFAVTADGFGTGRLFALSDSLGSEKFSVLDNGNILTATSSYIGIGTTSPWAQVSINPNGISGPIFAIGSSTATKLVMTNGGWIGVGTTSPSAKLSVTADGTGTGRLFAVADSNNAEKFTVLDNGMTGIGSTSPSARFSVSTTSVGRLMAMSASNGVENWTVVDDGKLKFGIATTSPSGILAINSSATLASSQRVFVLSNTPPAGVITERFSIKDYGAGAVWLVATTTIIQHNGTTNGGIFFPGNVTIPGGPTFPNVLTQDTSHFYWDNTNIRLGVGTSSPYARISVWGSGTGTENAFEVVDNASSTKFSIKDNGAVNLGPSGQLNFAKGDGTKIDFLAAVDGSGNSEANTSYIDHESGYGVGVFAGQGTGGGFFKFTTGGNGEVMRIASSTIGWPSVAIGTSTSNANLTVFQSGGNPSIEFGYNSDGNNHWMIGQAGGSGGQFFIASTSDVTKVMNPAFNRFMIDGAGNVGIGTVTPTHPLEMGSGAYVTTGGVWTNASSRDLKENFTELDSSDILQKINQLSITRWNYKTEPSTTMHIGPIAQDFYKAFGLGGIDGNRAISTIDPAGVALLGIQALSKLTNSVKDGAMIFGDPVDLNLQNKNIVEIASLVSSSGNWSLDNDGNLKVSEIKANKLCLGSTCIDEDTLKAILKSSGLMPTEASHSTPPSSDTLNDSTSSLSVNTDTEAPVITLNGDASSTLNVGDSFVDQGATVTDNVDHNLGVTVSGSVDTNTSGVYSLYYDATDNAGNKAEQKVRVITIK